MSKWISVDELIEFCDTERSMLNAHNGGNSVACAALRRVVDFVKEYAVEAEPNTNKGWISVKDEMPPEDEAVLAWNKEGFPMIDVWLGKMWGCAWTVDEISHWMPLPQKPESEVDAE